MRGWRSQFHEGLHYHLPPEVPVAGVSAVLAELERADRAGLEACLKWAIGSVVCRTRLLTAGGEIEVAAKLFRWRGLRGALSDLGLGSKARRSVQGYERIHEAAIPTPEPLAVVERRRGGLVVESYLITRFLDDAREFPDAVLAAEGNTETGRTLAGALGDLIGRLHAAGIDHPDLKHRNILERPGPELVLLDLDALVPRHRLTWRRRVRALGQLEAYTARDYPWLGVSSRWTFLNAYLDAQPELRARRSELVRDVRAWARSRLERWKADAGRARRAQERFEQAQARSRSA